MGEATEEWNRVASLRAENASLDSIKQSAAWVESELVCMVNNGEKLNTTLSAAWKELRVKLYPWSKP